MKYLSLSLIIIFVLSCKKIASKKVKKTTKPKITRKILKKLTKLKAISYFGEPIIQDEFLMSDGSKITRFRIELYNFHEQGENILLEELTWKKNKKKKITAWYEAGKTEIPIHILVHRDGEKPKITRRNLKKLTKLKAISYFGEPIIQDEFLMSDGSKISEFRIELYNFYEQGENILLEELTWKKNKKKKITAWYEADQNEIPVHIIVWHKDAEF